MLLEWNVLDPPDAGEMRRNDIIFDTYQHNRNPFIDHPEWAARHLDDSAQVVSGGLTTSRQEVE